MFNFSKQLTLLPNTLNSGVPVAPISTSKSPSAVSLPMTLTVSLQVVALFNVTPDLTAKISHLPVGRRFYYFAMRNFVPLKK